MHKEVVYLTRDGFGNIRVYSALVKFECEEELSHSLQKQVYENAGEEFYHIFDVGYLESEG